MARIRSGFAASSKMAASTFSDVGDSRTSPHSLSGSAACRRRGMTETLVAITGRPHAMASSTAFGNPSATLRGEDEEVRSLQGWPAPDRGRDGQESARLSLRPSSWVWASSAARRGPSPIMVRCAPCPAARRVERAPMMASTFLPAVSLPTVTSWRICCGSSNLAGASVASSSLLNVVAKIQAISGFEDG